MAIDLHNFWQACTTRNLQSVYFLHLRRSVNNSCRPVIKILWYWATRVFVITINKLVFVFLVVKNLRSTVVMCLVY